MEWSLYAIACIAYVGLLWCSLPALLACCVFKSGGKFSVLQLSYQCLHQSRFVIAFSQRCLLISSFF